jgi:large subunit ribosomal protein L18e
MKTGPERRDIIDALIILRSKKNPLFKKVAAMLSAPRRQRVIVNVSKISRYSKPKSTVVVAGKVLGDGTIAHAVDVVAMDFAASAREKIEGAGGKCRDIKWLVEKGNKDVILLK